MEVYDTALVKHPISLTASVEGFSGISYQVRVDFLKNTFAAFEWRNRDNVRPFTNIIPRKHGSIQVFKTQIINMKIWDWKPHYWNGDGIVLEGKYWSVHLKTKGKVYISEGTQCFPANWDLFCHAVEELTGSPFC
jgi:hypothetical protein